MASEERDKVERWSSQFRRGFLELCVLTLIENRRRLYGFEMIELLAGVGLEVGEGTLYPLLARMATERLLQAEWDTPESGHPRKFYSLSPLGRATLRRMENEFETHVKSWRSLRRGV